MANSRRYKALKQEMLNASNSVKLNEILVIQRTPHLAALFLAVDGQRTIKQVVLNAMASSSSKSSYSQVLSEFKNIFTLMIKVSLIYLREKTVINYVGIPEMEARMYDFYGKDECLRK